MSLVTYEVQGMVGIITINRPAQLNALNNDVLGNLSDVLDQVDINEIRCVVLTGAGEKAFVAGADISAMATLDQKGGKTFSAYGSDIFLKLENLPIPAIAAINGFALGGGCELAMACDIRICSEKAQFGQPEVGLGVIPGFGGTQRLPRLVGASIAKQLLYTGERIRADEALRIGLVNAIYPAEELMAKALEMAARIANNAPIAVRACKQAVREGIEMPLEDALKMESKMFGECFETEDQRNGMGAFLEKRKPDPFVNR